MNGTDKPVGEYTYEGRTPDHSHQYLAPVLLGALGPGRGRTLLDLGCGNGTLTQHYADAGFETTGTDSSSSGVAMARAEYPHLKWDQHDIDEPLPAALHNRFDVVVAAEVIEHLFFPRMLFQRAQEALKPGGRLLISTPFHGYWKNLALALTNKCDQHWLVSWDFGHIKFFSRPSLTDMAVEGGFEPVEWRFVGRVPQLAKSMAMVAERKADR